MPDDSADRGRQFLDAHRAAAKPAAPGGPRIFTFREVQDLQIPETRWVIPGLVAEGVILYAGPPKSGKSWLALNLAIAKAAGASALGRYDCERGAVLYLALEDNARRFQGRLAMNLCGQPAPGNAYFAMQWPALDAGGIEALAKFHEEHRPELIIIDTFAKVRPKSNGRGRIYDEDYAALSGLKRFADAKHVAIIVIHHTSKASSDDPFATVSGTLGLTGAADAIVIMKRERGRMDAVLHITGRDVEEQEIAINFDSRICTWTAMGDADGYRLTEERAAILEVLRRGNTDLSAKEIAAMLEKSYNATRQLLFKMVRAGEVINHRGKYQLPTPLYPHNPDNNSNRDNSSNTGNSSNNGNGKGVTGSGSVTGVTGVTGDSRDRGECQACDGEGCSHCGDTGRNPALI